MGRYNIKPVDLYCYLQAGLGTHEWQSSSENMIHQIHSLGLYI